MNGPSILDSSNLLSDYVLLLETTQIEMQTLLDVFTRWETRYKVYGKPERCTVLVQDLSLINEPFKLGNQTVPTKQSAKY